MGRRVVVTGIGLICGVGNTAEEVWGKLLAGKSGVGPITVDPALQNDGAGRALMNAVMERSAERGFVGIRLVQAPLELLLLHPDGRDRGTPLGAVAVFAETRAA